jgi:hypothetical protein
MVEWAANDRSIQTDDSAESPLESFDMPKRSGVEDAFMLSYDAEKLAPDQHQEHWTAIYWTSKGKFFAAYLEYLVGDPKSTELKNMFFGTVRSFRPLQDSTAR